jgi:3-keto-5-aminohexanoate cleavage enzyme
MHYKLDNSDIREWMKKNPSENVFYVPENIVSIDNRTFADCPQLKEIILPLCLSQFGDDVFENTMPMMRAFGQRMMENNIKPEYECFEMGHLDTVLNMAKKGQVPGAPMQFNFVLGVPGCTPATIPNLCWLVNSIPAGSTWTATGIGRHQFTLAAAAIAMGGNVRVGFEDSIYIEKGVLAKSNGEMVAKVVRMAKELGREIATSAEAREILGLKPRN